MSMIYGLVDADTLELRYALGYKHTLEARAKISAANHQRKMN